MPEPLEQRLQPSSSPLLLDGATGTELNRRGIDTALPLWSTTALLEEHGRNVLLQVHRDYRDAGADILTANTFRTFRRTLARAGMADKAEELTRLAVELAREAAERRCWVVGSQPPLEDCYSPERVPDDAALSDEHAEMAEHLAGAGVDAILVETHNTIREAQAATQAAADTGRPVLVSFVCGEDGRLLSGETLMHAAMAVAPFHPAAVLVNCVPADAVLLMLQELQDTLTDTRLGVYANIGRPDPQQGWVNTDAQDPETYAAYAQRWLRFGAHIVGGCCGTTPEHIRQLRTLIEEQTHSARQTSRR